MFLFRCRHPSSMPDPISQPTHHKPFTLIELLVVVSIISVLASILLPALGKARGSAQQLSCLNNVRQLGMTFQNYLDDTGGHIPMNLASGQRPNVQDAIDTMLPKGTPRGMDWTTSNQKYDFRKCPSVWNRVNVVNAIHYNANDTWDNEQSTPVARHAEGHVLDTAKMPESYPTFFDAGLSYRGYLSTSREWYSIYGAGPYQLLSTAEREWYSVGPEHGTTPTLPINGQPVSYGNIFNAVFADGHGRGVPIKEVIERKDSWFESDGN